MRSNSDLGGMVFAIPLKSKACLFGQRNVGRLARMGNLADELERARLTRLIWNMCQASWAATPLHPGMVRPFFRVRVCPLILLMPLSALSMSSEHLLTRSDDQKCPPKKSQGRVSTAMSALCRTSDDHSRRFSGGRVRVSGLSMVQLGGVINQACSSDPSEQSLCRSELPSNQISNSTYRQAGLRVS